jgi:hypothetical protein
MQALIGSVAFLLMGFLFLWLANNEWFLKRASWLAPNTTVQKLAVKTGAIFNFVLSALCLTAFIAWLFGLIK